MWISSNLLNKSYKFLPLTILVLAVLLGSCQDQIPSNSQKIDPPPSLTGFPSPTPQSTTRGTEPTAAAIEEPTFTSASSPAESQPTAEHTPTAAATNEPSATPDIYAQFSIEALSGRDYGGGQLEIVDTLEENDSFTRYLVTYPSDGLTVFGFMNVPNEGTNFPVAILVHGYIPPSEYQTIAYTTRYADNLARAGYFVLHPNLRNHRPSDQGPDQFRTGYAVDILNLIEVVKEQSQDPRGYFRRADTDDINLWGHSMGGGIVLRTITVNNDPTIRTAVLYGSMSGDEALNFERILFWSDGAEGEFELGAPSEALEAISPIYHLDRISASISIHHSDSDEQVPAEWSADLCQRLQAIEHPTECFTYLGLPHTFRGQGDVLFMERVIEFFNRH